MSIEQMNFYQRKLAYEMDSADLYEAQGKHEPIVVVDGRSADAYAHEHIPGAISLPHRGISFSSTESTNQSSTFATATASDATPRPRRPSSF